MSNPFEYRELMRAQFRYDEARSVDQILAEHKKRRDDQARESKRKSKGAGTGPLRPPAHGVVDQSERAKVMAMLNKNVTSPRG